MAGSDFREVSLLLVEAIEFKPHHQQGQSVCRPRVIPLGWQQSIHRPSDRCGTSRAPPPTQCHGDQGNHNDEVVDGMLGNNCCSSSKPLARPKWSTRQVQYERCWIWSVICEIPEQLTYLAGSAPKPAYMHSTMPWSVPATLMLLMMCNNRSATPTTRSAPAFAR